MIPDHNHSGVLPPFIGDQPTTAGKMAPYKTCLLNIAKRFANNPNRVKIFQGLISYRAALRSIGITEGFQWIDGSFVENCELIRGRFPNDIDLITFIDRSKCIVKDEDLRSLLDSREDIFDASKSKERYFCDAYFVDLTRPPIYLVSQTVYWFGLFSHQRDTSLWKGMLEIPLNSDDSIVVEFLESGVEHASKT